MQVPANVLGKAADGAPKAWATATRIGNSDVVLLTWNWPGSLLEVTAICRNKSKLSPLSLCRSHSDFQIDKSTFKKMYSPLLSISLLINSVPGWTN